MMVGLLGILKAGGAYLPLDPTYPQDASPSCSRMPARRVLLTQSALLDRIPATRSAQHRPSRCRLAAIARQPASAPANHPRTRKTPPTSSTPQAQQEAQKESCVTHQNVVQLRCNRTLCLIWSSDVCGAIDPHSFAFDVSI